MTARDIGPWGAAILGHWATAEEGGPAAASRRPGSCTARDAGPDCSPRWAYVPTCRWIVVRRDWPITAVELAPARALLGDLADVVRGPRRLADRVLLACGDHLSARCRAAEAGRAWDADLLAVDARLQAYVRAGSRRAARGGSLQWSCSRWPHWAPYPHRPAMDGRHRVAGDRRRRPGVTGSDGYDFSSAVGDRRSGRRLSGQRATAVAVAGVVTISAREIRAHGLTRPIRFRSRPGSRVDRVEQLVDRGQLADLGRLTGLPGTGLDRGRRRLESFSQLLSTTLSVSHIAVWSEV